ncbi:class I SAM-dependent methyltransferase [Promethearchaeum syntrophicum]|uniref:Class I SAM-dependent methyltransferase n=1 Tax=Promethearchaeum syntrophicum TaxID=2594042 RepID=A0A5B9DDS6_9ARCH|nr:class I SAM-dependent methyltransferase [Candidatus Prometheoarchaeum syntrophicum]QEE17398.1 bifunctional 3-demethylubiquinone-9 3-methyltransferase/ 2-octaprenyl-6-hydroxy phenol methylase [Candidatus Prometheoarchaeum syntrophicum]
MQKNSLIKAMEPFGLALADYFLGKEVGDLFMNRDDGSKDKHPVEYYFRNPSDFSLFEKEALKLCKGKTLDIGAGVGPHSLELQKRGLKVHSIDISTHACDIMKERGLKNVECMSYYDFCDLHKENFDTILLLGRSIGFVENLNGLKKFLMHCKSQLNQNGNIIFDSSDLRVTTKPIHLAYQKKNQEEGSYLGEIRLQMEYKGLKGNYFKILHVDPDSLAKIVLESKMKYEIVMKEETGGGYLVRIFV